MRSRVGSDKARKDFKVADILILAFDFLPASQISRVLIIGKIPFDAL